MVRVPCTNDHTMKNYKIGHLGHFVQGCEEPKTTVRPTWDQRGRHVQEVNRRRDEREHSRDQNDA
ncbi:hypothetical protein CR513_23941, partial [Mucuna pruriens]